MEKLSKQIVILAVLLFIVKISIADHLRENNSKKVATALIFDKLTH